MVRLSRLVGYAAALASVGFEPHSCSGAWAAAHGTRAGEVFGTLSLLKAGPGPPFEPSGVWTLRLASLRAARFRFCCRYFTSGHEE